MNDSQKAKLEAYYGVCCAVSGNPEFEWHHLDDDESNTVVENMIPLSSGLNRHLRDINNSAKKRENPILRPEVDPDDLERQSALLFNSWELGRAYGCARLSVFVSKQYLKENADSVVLRSCQALYLTRHRVNYVFMADVLRRDILPLLEQKGGLSSRTRFWLGRELGGILSEHGQAEKACGLYESILSRPDASPVSDKALASTLRRQAMTLHVLPRNSKNARELLSEALALAGEDLNLKIGIANSQAWMAIQGGEFGLALERLQPLVQRIQKSVFSASGYIRPINVTAWNIAELFYNFAIALSGARPSRYKLRRDEALLRALRIFQRSGAMPYDFHAGYWKKVLKNSNLCEVTRPEFPRFRTGLPAVVDNLVNRAVLRLV